MKITIHSDVHMVCEWIKTTISLLVCPIPNKDTFNSSWFQFCPNLFGKMDICYTPKDFGGRERVKKESMNRERALSGVSC